VFHVVVLELARPVEAEEQALGAILGWAQYDVRMRLSGVLPRLVFESPESAEAERVAQAFAERGHTVKVFPASSVVPLERLVAMHRFSFEGDVVFASDRKPAQRAQDLLAIVHFETRASVVRTGKEKVLRYSGRAPHTEEVETFRHEGLTEDALMLVWRDASRWLLRAGNGRYLALGPDLKTTQRENFRTTVDKLRALSPRATYDDRFVRNPINAQGVLVARGNEQANSHGDSRTDLALQALASMYLGRDGGPYRSMPRP
jgi:hypothetical protein